MFRFGLVLAISLPCLNCNKKKNEAPANPPPPNVTVDMGIPKFQIQCGTGTDKTACLGTGVSK